MSQKSFEDFKRSCKEASESLSRIEALRKALIGKPIVESGSIKPFSKGVE